MRFNNPRELALEGYKRVTQGNGYSNLVIHSLLTKSNLSQKDKTLAAKIIYGTLQWQKLIDYYLKVLSKRPLEKLSPVALFLLRTGAYQILFLDRVPNSAVVDETVKIAKKKGHKGIAGFVNGVLRNLIRNGNHIELPSHSKDPISYFATKYSHPSWMVKAWYETYGGEKTEEILQENNQTPEQTIRTNTLLIEKDDLVKELSEGNQEVEGSDKVEEAIHFQQLGDLDNNELFKKGYFQVQDLNSMLVSKLLAPRPGERIIDLCSAPGGKTTHIAQMMNNQGVIKAVDLHPHRIDLVNKAARRLNISIIELLVMDARDLLGTNDSQVSIYDGCLLDAPCSGLGTIRRRPEIKWRITKEQVTSLSKIQWELLRVGSYMVRSGGRLLYSTCTLSLEENQRLIETFLKEYPEFEAENPTDILAKVNLAGGEVSEDRDLQFFPGYKKGDGFFMVRLKKQ